MNESQFINPDRYSTFSIEPLDFIVENDLDFLQGNIIKYIWRYSHISNTFGSQRDIFKYSEYIRNIPICVIISNMFGDI